MGSRCSSCCGGGNEEGSEQDDEYRPQQQEGARQGQRRQQQRLFLQVRTSKLSAFRNSDATFHVLFVLRMLKDPYSVHTSFSLPLTFPQSMCNASFVHRVMGAAGATRGPIRTHRRPGCTRQGPPPRHRPCRGSSSTRWSSRL